MSAQAPLPDPPRRGPALLSGAIRMPAPRRFTNI
jgi:hypothetical protein